MTKRKVCFLLLALLLLACGKGGDYEEMHELLMKAKAQNENYEPFVSDSMMLSVADYFDRNGTANEKMLAHYLLGCVYRDLGDMPRSLECYHQAVACADTTDADCDYLLLGKVHGQMAYIYNKELLPQYQLEQLLHCRRYSLLAGDTLAAIKAEDFSASAYYLLGNTDSCIAIKERCAELYLAHGENLRFAEAHSALTAFYLERGAVEKAAVSLAKAEQTKEFFMSNGNVISGREIFYYNKGLLHLAEGDTDKAEQCFRRLAAVADADVNKRIAAVRGLALLFEKQGWADSTAKYAMKAYALNDTINQRLMQSALPTMQALYDYSRYKDEAAKKSQEAEHTKMLVLILVAVLLATVFVAYVFISKTRRRKEEQLAQQQHEYEMKMTLLAKANDDLDALLAESEERNRQLIEQKTAEIENYKRQIAAYKNDGRTAEERLVCSSVVKRFQQMGKTATEPTEADWEELRKLINMELPEFYGIMNANGQLPMVEYHICILIKLGFGIKEMCNLTGFDKYKMSKIRRHLLQQVYQTDGSSSDFDKLVRKIKSVVLF